jgi:hypothetical protein
MRGFYVVIAVCAVIGFAAIWWAAFGMQTNF